MACNPDGTLVDLHIHSTASDGSLTPAEILASAVELGLGAIAITDHDTVSGVHEALEQGIPENLGFVTGMEISADHPPGFSPSGTLHILGYGMNVFHPGLLDELAVCQEARRERNPKIIQKLADLGIPITLEQVRAVSGGGQVGRPHIARVLLELKAVKTVEEAFVRFIGKGGPAYVDKHRLPAERAIRMIRDAGGVAVLAHPSSLEVDENELAALVKSMAGMGLSGIEVHYPGHVDRQIGLYLTLARRFGLFPTGGTDFHGKSKPKIQMGSGTGNLAVPYSIFENLLASLPAPADAGQGRAAPD